MARVLNTERRLAEVALAGTRSSSARAGLELTSALLLDEQQRGSQAKSEKARSLFLHLQHGLSECRRTYREIRDP